MALSLSKSITAMAAGGLTTSVVGQGGLEPYTYSLLAGGAGGSIDSSGIYTAPLAAPADPKFSIETIQVEDANGDTALGTLLITTPLGLFCEIIQQELGVAPGRVYLWDQKINQPTDSGLYVAVSVLNSKPFGNSYSIDSGGVGLDAVQSINVMDSLQVDIISRGPEARLRKEEVLLALASNYSQSQQQLNSFLIGRLPAAGQFVNLSNVDGAAIPYRFSVTINVQYFIKKIKAAPYYDDFSLADVITEP